MNRKSLENRLLNSNSAREYSLNNFKRSKRTSGAYEIIYASDTGSIRNGKKQMKILIK